VPQLRACLRGRSYRSRLYSPERLLYPMLRVGKRGEGKFKRVSWDEALDFRRPEDGRTQAEIRPDGDPRPGLRRHLVWRAAQVGPDRGLLARFLGMFGCRTNSWSVPSYQGTTFSSRMTFGTIRTATRTTPSRTAS
jgi:anaerobic dimethyl sulfoxide reductase subunit A